MLGTFERMMMVIDDGGGCVVVHGNDRKTPDIRY